MNPSTTTTGTAHGECSKVKEVENEGVGVGGGSNVVLGILASSFLGVIMVTSPFVTMQLRSKLPYMSTPRRKVVEALKDIERRKWKKEKKAEFASASASASASLNDASTSVGSPPSSTPASTPDLAAVSSNKRLRFFDLGSGDGETVLAAASLGWRATGVELNSTLWMISSIRRLMASSSSSISSSTSTTTSSTTTKTLSSSVRSHCNFVYGDMWKMKIHNADAVMIFGVKPLMGDIANKIERECQPGTFVMSYRFHIPTRTRDRDRSSSSSSSSSSGHSHKVSDDNDDNDNDGANDDSIITGEKIFSKAGAKMVGSPGSADAANINDDGKLGADLVYDKDEMRIYELRDD